MIRRSCLNENNLLVSRGLVMPVQLKKLDQCMTVNAHVLLRQPRNTIAAGLVAELKVEIRHDHYVIADCFLDVKLANGRKFKRQSFFIVYDVGNTVSLGHEFFGHLKQVQLSSGLPHTRMLSVHFGRNGPVANAFLNGRHVITIFDTSTTKNYVGPQAARGGTEVRLGNFTERQIGGSVVASGECCKLDIDVGENSYHDQLFFVDPNLKNEVVLGLSFLEQHRKVLFNYSGATAQGLNIRM